MPRLPALLLACALASCATPIPPSGGPADTTPPALVASEPASGAIRVRGDVVALEFSEAVDEASVRRALTVAPPPETPPEVRVRGRRVEVRFPGGLRDSTTYVLTLGRELRDERSVALPAPIPFAFSTGDELDRGAIAGVVRRPDTGAGAGNLSVWAYWLADSAALPDPRTTRPDYQTETDGQGRFQLGYLRRGAYYVIVAEDRNRNARADAGEGFAAPPRPAIRAVDAETGPTTTPDSLAAADTLATPPLQTTAEAWTFWVARTDSLAPALRRVRPASDSRLAVRFSEPVRLRDAAPDAWALRDTTGARVAVRSVYADPADSAQVVLTTPPLAPVPHRLALARATAVTDTAGNAAVPDTLRFTPPTTPDTLRARFEAFVPAGQPRPGQRPGVRFSAPPDSAALAERLAVTDTLGAPLTHRLLRRSTRVEVADAPPVPLRLAWRADDTTLTRTFTPIPVGERGELAGVVAGAKAPVWVELRSEGGPPLRARADSTGAFLVEGLPEGAYALRVWADRDGDGQWSPGALVPYQPPEPLLIPAEGARVRARWTVELDTLRF